MIPSWGTSPAKPRPSQTLTAYYFHAGGDGRADVMECLIQLTTEFNKDATFDFAIDLRVHEVDLLLGGSTLDLQAPGRKASILSALSDAHFVFITPPYKTFARARHCNHAGPKPLRDKTWPRGRPRLQQADREAVQLENVVLDFIMDVLHLAGEKNVPALLEAPEDLGKARLGIPASIWQWRRMRDLARWGFVRAAFLFSDFDNELNAKPSAVIANIDVAKLLPQLRLGWPTFDAKGMYSGPLTAQFKPAARQPAKQEDGSFLTALYGKLPPAVALQLTGALFQSHCLGQSGSKGLDTPLDGGSSSPGDLPVVVPPWKKGKFAELSEAPSASMRSTLISSSGSGGPLPASTRGQSQSADAVQVPAPPTPPLAGSAQEPSASSSSPSSCTAAAIQRAFIQSSTRLR